MSRSSRIVVVTLVVLLVSVVGYGAWRNSERETLTPESRAGVSGSFVALPAGVTHYELSGPDTGRVVVLVHGFSVPYYIWDSTAVALTAAGRRVLRYDLFGRGWSDRPAAAYDGTMYDAQLVALLDSLGITEPVDLVGLSFGGYVVSHFVSTHRDRVHTLTLVDPSSTSRPLPLKRRLPVVGPWLFQLQVVPGMADGQFSDFLHPTRFPDWADRYRPQMRYRGFGRALLRSAATLSHTDFTALFATVGESGVPTLLIWGRQDPTVPFANADSVKRGIPDLTFVPVDSAGHLPIMEQSAVTHAAMLAFFAANDS